MKVVQTFVNIGPIVDFSVVDLDRRRQDHQEYIVTCFGVFKDGSLRILKHGVRINEEASA